MEEEQDRPFVMVGGKKYVLAEDEQAEPTGPEPEIFQRLTEPPRSVSLAVRLLLLLNNGSAPMFGWIFACFGMIFNIVFLPMAFGGLVDWIHWGYEPAGKGEIVEVVDAKTKVNEREIFRYVFKQTDGNKGQCYTGKGRFKIGDSVDLEQSGSKVRISGTQLSPMGRLSIFPIFVVIFPPVGISIVLYGTFQGRKAIRLLQDGEVGRGRFIDMKATGISVGGAQPGIKAHHSLQPKRYVMKLHYKFTADDGETYDAYATALDTSRLTDDSVEALFYDPMDPTQSVLLDSLPGKVRFDEMERTFKANPFRVVLPVLFCGLFIVELAALIYAISVGGIVPVG